MILGFKSKSRTGYLAVSILSVFAIIVMRLFSCKLLRVRTIVRVQTKVRGSNLKLNLKEVLIYAMEWQKAYKNGFE